MWLIGWQVPIHIMFLCKYFSVFRFLFLDTFLFLPRVIFDVSIKIQSGIYTVLNVIKISYGRGEKYFIIYKCTYLR
jgi:hypothetical protein